jgi:nitroimidazol reductase NimA-like FMN-containing flavoprotein (pyridoxamine 5'-phosphate oxidase superfamily)
MSEVRSRSQRRIDTLAKLGSQVDLWVASADEAGRAYLVPLSYYWDGSSLTIATPRASRTARNLMRAGWARVALGPTRDVVIIEGPVEEIPTGSDPPHEEAHAEATGFDPRTLAEEYVYLRITPHEIQAWREANELEGRQLMRGGEWLAGSESAAPEAGGFEPLPEWPTRTIAVLATLDDGPHAIPVSAPLRAGDRRILFSLHRSRGSLSRLRERPEVALAILTEGNVAFTATGRARIVEEPMAAAPDYAAVAIDVEHIKDHRQPEFLVEAGVDRRWLDERERDALRARVSALTQLASEAEA